jgi:hypothetical protein
MSGRQALQMLKDGVVIRHNSWNKHAYAYYSEKGTVQIHGADFPNYADDLETMKYTIELFLDDDGWQIMPMFSPNKLGGKV